MGQVYPAIDEQLARWMKQQHVFFVATAPIAGEGLINCSPKGLDTLAILDAQTVAYLDLTGSGVETIAHLQENGRIVLLFCAFENAAKIVRLHGTGTVLRPSHPSFDSLRPSFPDLPGVRAIIRVAVQRIADSCGYGVPLYDYKEQRPTYRKFAEQVGPERIAAYQAEHNRCSLDGLPALTTDE